MCAASVEEWVRQQVESYPLLKALIGRRSRRFGAGMAIPSGPFEYTSQHPPQPLTEEEEAAMVFSAAGLTGYALADLSYGPGEGGSMLAGMTGRVVGSGDSMDTVSLFVINDDGAYFIRRPQNLTPGERDDLVALGREGHLVEAYRRLRVKISDERATAPLVPGANFNVNRWALYVPGSTYFLPINDLTGLYINALLEAFEPQMGLFVVDERRSFLPAGIARFAKSRGGHLWDDFTEGRGVTVQALEMSFAEATAVEMGGMLQGLGLMGQALGLGGYCNYARSEYQWFESLGFDVQKMRSTEYAGANPVLSAATRLVGQEFTLPYPTGLHHDGETLLEAYCPPNYPDMESAVRAYVNYKFGADGMWRGRTRNTSWQAPEQVAPQIAPPSEEAVEATIAYCTYIEERYGRFPAYAAPYRTVIGYQATHVDADFYDRFFRGDALTETQRERFAMWVSPTSDATD